MRDRTKTIAAIAILMGIFSIILISIVVIMTRSKTISPIPEESAIKIIFISPTPLGEQGSIDATRTSTTKTTTPVVPPVNR